ncbi:lateral eye opsin-like [Limulus polyphemus]|uniref:Lateral eye opsin-like n=1 Tax=Limulus polyphemus TaxID=6850 RepID=C1K2X1_LIMPO|nr:lateral eye opsin-like [Limulus polyphemus]ACO05013.1 opsin 5 [Limulus polyphemus]
MSTGSYFIGNSTAPRSSGWWSYDPGLSVRDTAPENIKHLISDHWSKFPAVNPMWHYLLGLIYIVLGIASLTGQSVVLYLFAKTKPLRTPANMLIVNLAFSDFMMMITQFPVFIINCLGGGAWQLGPLLCEITGFAGGLFGYGSIVTLAVISIDRYNVIVRGFSASPLTHARSAVFILVIWAWTLGWALPPFFGWGRYVPEGILNSCSFDYLTRDWATVSYIMGCWICEYALPLMVIIYCYIFIVKAVCDHERHLREQAKKMNVASLRSNVDTQKASAEMRIAKVALVNVLLWVVSWTPYAAIAMIGIAGDQMLITPLRSALPALAGKAASVYNPIVYAISHPKFRLAMQKEIPCCCINEPQPQSDTSSEMSTKTSVATVNGEDSTAGGTTNN